MHNPTTRRHRSHEQWHAILAEQVASGLSQKAYCERHDITLSAFYNAKYRLKSRSLVDAADCEFVAVALDDAASALSPVASWDVELSLGDGVVLRVRRTGGVS